MSPQRQPPERQNRDDHSAANAPGSTDPTDSTNTDPASSTPGNGAANSGSTNAQAADSTTNTNDEPQTQPQTQSPTHPQTQPRRPFEFAASRSFMFPEHPDTPFENVQDSFTDRLHNFLEAHRSSGSRDSAPETLREQTPDPAPEPSTSQNIMGMFDEILDSVLGHRSDGPTAAPQNATGDSTGAPGAAGSVNNVDGATVFTTGGAGGTGEGREDNPGAIVITVNYMFMDGTNDPTPGRTGSLVVTIPNNATNREPHIISSFIQLATRMAYSALINRGPKPKPGVTLDKFRSFKTLNVDYLTDKNCSVCFEEYEKAPSINVWDLMTTKRRKLSPARHAPSGSATPESEFSSLAQISRENPPSGETDGSTGDQTPREATEPGDASGESQEEPQKVYLCDHDEEFDHTPLQMPCGHVFGRSCLAHWLKESTSCPLCRLSVAEAEETPARSTGIPPISYIRFGELDGLSGGLFNSPEGPQQSAGNASEGPSDERSSEQDSTPVARQRHTQDSNNSQGNQETSTLPSLLRRATSVIFNSSARRPREAPPPPLRALRSGRDRNPPFTPMINNIQNYFRRSRRQRDRDSSGSNSLFSSGVSSRRTPNGVETVSSDANPMPALSSGFFMHDLGSSGGPSRGSESEDTYEDTSDRTSGPSTRNGQADVDGEHEAQEYQES